MNPDLPPDDLERAALVRALRRESALWQDRLRERYLTYLRLHDQDPTRALHALVVYVSVCLETGHLDREKLIALVVCATGLLVEQEPRLAVGLN